MMAAASETTTREFRLHPQVPVLWFVQAVVFAVAVATIGSVVLLARGAWLFIPLAWLGAGAWAVFNIAYGRAYIRRFRALLLPDGLLVVRGVWWRSEVFVPRARVQHTDVTQGPLARYFGMATLKVFTAGTQHSLIDVPDLAHESAVTLRDTLLDRGASDAL
jgi:uncharacterized protein